ncbi:MAG: T9SS type A sorting domain-containing protein, partial [Bacteroidota bacterium]
GSYTYFWNNSQTGATATGLAAGDYTVTVTDGHGCTTTALATVSGPSATLAATAAGTKVVTCYGNTDGEAKVYPSYGWGSYTYFWNNSQTGSTATGLAAGIYTVTVTDGHGCTTTATATVSGPSAALAATAAGTKVVTCYGNTDGEATVYPSHGWGSYTYFWNNSQTGATAAGLGAGDYTVTVTDGHGCTITALATVSGPSAALAATASGTKVVTCFGDADGEATVYPSHGWGSYTYYWNNSQTGSTATGLVVGDYTVTVTDGIGCTSTAAAAVTGPSATLAATAAETKVVTCFGSSDGTATVYPSHGWGSYTYFWNNSQTGSTATGLGVGTYTVTVTDGHGCTTTASATVTGPSASLAASAAGTKVVTCFGGSDGTATVYPSDGWGSYTYFWNNSQTGSVATGLAAGSYTVTVTDGHGCTTTASATVDGPSAALAASAAGTKVVTCFGDTDGTATVYPSFGWGSYSFFWNDSQTTAVATGLGAGNYTVTVTDGNGCTVTASATVSGPSASLAASAVETKPVSCFGLSDGTATVTASNGWGSYSYMWNNSQTGATATGLANGTYTVTVTDGIGCTTTASAYVSQPSAALSSTYIKTDVLGCHGEHTGAIDLTVNGGTAPYYFVWTGTGVNATAEDQSGLAAGTYNVTITDARSCETSTSAIISQPDTLHSNVMITHVNCNSDPSGTINPHMSGGTPPYSYVWDYDYPFTTDSILTGMVAGDYNVTVTDDHSCVFVIGPITITQPDQLYVNDIVYNVTCKGGSDGHIDQDFITGGVSPYYYQWSSGPTTPSISGLTAGFYTLTVTDSHSCTLIQPAQEVSEPMFYLGASASQSKPVTCYNGIDGEATVIASGGWGSYTYYWNNSSTASSITGLTAGTYSVTVTDVKGCSTTASAVVYQPSAAIAASAAETKVVSCVGGNDGAATVYPSFGWGSYSYFWNNSQTGATATGLSIGTYTVTVTDINGCIATASASVTQPSTALAASAAETKIVSCFGGNDGEATVYPSFGWGSYSYSWSNTQTSTTASGLTAGTYTVTVTDGHGCTTTASASVGQPSAALATTATHVDVLCKGGASGSIDLSVNGGTPSYTYAWTGTGVVATAQDQSGLIAGTYYVTVTDSKNCSKSTAVTIAEPDYALAVSITPTGVSCHGDSNGSATVNVSGGTSGYTYIWSTSPVQTTGTISNLAPGNYSVTVTDAHTCIATGSTTINEPAVLSLSGNVTSYSCNHGGSVTTTVSGGTTAYHYIWNNGQTTSAITGLSAGTYSVTVSDAHNCSQTGSWQVITTTIGINGPDTVCCMVGNQYNYQATVTNSCTPLIYQWAVSGGSILSGQNTAAITVEWGCCGNGTVSLLVHNCDGCNITKDLPVIVNTPPAPSISGPVQVVSGQTNVQYCTPASAQIGHVYVWTIAGGSITSGQGTTCINVTWGPYPVCGCGSVTLSESYAGCMASENYPVTMLPWANIRISGYVSYLNTLATKMNGVAIQLRNSSNVIIGNAITANNPASGQPGYYAFTDLPNDTYSLHGSYSGTWGGNNATDALIVQLNAIMSYPLAGVRAVAADVNASTTITALDALYIKLRTVGAISSYPAGDWKVTDTIVTLTGTAALPVDLKMLCTGDVNGSFVPGAFKETSSLSSVEDGIMAVTVGEPFTYNIHSTKAADLGAMTLFLGYDASRFEVIDVAGLPDGMKFAIGNGKVAIAWSDTKALKVKASDLVLSLNMRVKEKISEPLQVFSINAGSEFADIMATPYENFDLKMASVLTPDGSKDFSMSNYPNPFAQTTTIIYNLPESGHVRLVLTDLLGNTLRTLEDQPEGVGIHTLVVDPAELHMASGVYLYKINFDNSTDNYTKTNKMVLTK